MATVQLNLDTLQRKGLLLNNPITLSDGSTYTFIDFESDPLTCMFVLETDTGDTIPMRSDVIGTVTVAGATKPTPKNGGQRQKIKKP